MSVKIRVSFERQQELEAVLEILKPVTTSYKVSKSNGRGLKKAYIDVREPAKPCV